MIELRNVSKRYPNGHKALDNVNFHLAPGDFVFLTGRSGAGKSTLLKLLAGLELPTQGDIRIGSFHLNNLSRKQLPELRRQIGMILQTPNLLMNRTVFDNVALPLVIAGYTHKEINNRVHAVLKKVSLDNREQDYPYELSGGEQQRIAIARAVINKPAVLLADEPTGNLDPKLAGEIMHLFAQFNRLGMTILIASHDLNLINNFHYPQFTLHEGKLFHEPAPA